MLGDGGPERIVFSGGVICAAALLKKPSNAAMKTAAKTTSDR
jgi:hypothetical protein